MPRQQPSSEILGAAVAALRRSNGMSQETFAAKIKMSVRYLSGIETGKRDPGWGMVIRVVDGLGLTLEDLVKEIDHQTELRGD